MKNPKYTTYHSTILDATADAVWAQVRDFMQILAIAFGENLKEAHWLKGGSVDKVPSLLEFTLLPNNDVFKEEVMERSEQNRSLTYRTVGQALQLDKYVASCQVLPVTNEPTRSFFAISREFRLVQGAAPEFLPSFKALLDQEINRIKAHFAG